MKMMSYISLEVPINYIVILASFLIDFVFNESMLSVFEDLYIIYLCVRYSYVSPFFPHILNRG